MPFSVDTGPQVLLPTSSLGIFSPFCTTSLLQYIVVQSNQYALECMGGETFGHWTQIITEELQAYMGFMVLMGIVHMPSIYSAHRKRWKTTFFNILCI